MMIDKLQPEMITGVKYSIGGFFGGSDYVVINRKGNTGAICAFHIPMFMTKERFYIQKYTSTQWNHLMDKLFNKLRVQDWEREYWNNDVCDGTQWELSFRLSSGVLYEINGSNEYPEGFDALSKMFRYYSDKRIDCDWKEMLRLSSLFKDDFEVRRVLEEYNNMPDVRRNDMF